MLNHTKSGLVFLTVKTGEQKGEATGMPSSLQGTYELIKEGYA